MINWNAWLFLLFLTILSYNIAALISAAILWRMRKTNGTEPLLIALALMELSVCVNGALEFVGTTFGRNGFEIPPKYTLGYILCFWSGRFIFSVGQWGVLAFLLYHRKHKKIEHA